MEIRFLHDAHVERTLNLCICRKSRGGQTFISFQSAREGLKASHLTFPVRASQKRLEMFDKLPPRQKERKSDVEDAADARPIMPPRRLEEPTSERRSCHGVFAKWQISEPHQRVSLCHSSRQDEISRSGVVHLSSSVEPKLSTWRERQQNWIGESASGPCDPLSKLRRSVKGGGQRWSSRPCIM